MSAKTVAELIQELSDLPSDMRVVTNGYEGGYHDCGTLKTIEVLFNVHSKWYYGEHDLAAKGVRGTKVVLISGVCAR